MEGVNNGLVSSKNNCSSFRESLKLPANKLGIDMKEKRINKIINEKTFPHNKSKRQCGFSYDPKLERDWEFYDEDIDVDYDGYEISTYINNHSNFSIGNDNHFPVPDGVEFDEDEDEEKYFHGIISER